MTDSIHSGKLIEKIKEPFRDIRGVKKNLRQSLSAVYHVEDMLKGPMKPVYKRVKDQDPKDWNNIPICLCESLKNISQAIMDLHSIVVF